MPAKKHLTRREAMAQRAAAAAAASSKDAREDDTQSQSTSFKPNKTSQSKSQSSRPTSADSHFRRPIDDWGHHTAWESVMSSEYPEQSGLKKGGGDSGATAADGEASKRKADDWYKSYGRDTGIVRKACTWEPDPVDKATNENLDLIEASMRIFHQVKDHATKYRKTFVASSPYPRWLLSVTLHVKIIVNTYEAQPEKSLTSYQRHVLELGRRGLKDLEDMKESEERRAGKHVWRVVDQKTGEMYPPRAVEDPFEDMEEMFSKLAAAKAREAAEDADVGSSRARGRRT